ncbi:hypothetical protein BJV85_003631 [Clostridium acetobutylicum]|uniref:Uncharacterized protein n=1 Tax=Clostridium acetobutylicum (strain ATCC 824 / DSM 792 / JCM 1419 / IAM 19013 / LMG 5710 / NBRC 13948 / NRRL B-527 / VKM B-1787 / 2291 / W) TaxID=272562 RepID=Q97M13_CLOAB|nr:MULTISPECIES: hypothetical protein [Clostridium]AAK78367.1 Hypothetical protein CA_C0387 [Clostridium acetobutylicum ATCC 824]ADZ19436.1 Conserved hypothetical protein [Clostridium acetobutylicum EA 2018]AEI31211.1 hypothetical protein SMB_G0395 [Clostridium acetobutylicum DSM 1731]AWV80091.1 hypothetical protein DK921_08290 [Clostridium acetobutylicum]KHD35338.1 hypothetical protein NL50_13585 [Clostridium acetobutylicum]
MKLFKIKITGSLEEFKIEYSFSTDYFNYKECTYEGTEQERYDQFYEDLKTNGGPQPLNIKLKMSNGVMDRAFPKKDLLKLKNVQDFVKKMYT